MTGKAKEKAKLNREWQQISAVSLLLNLMMYTTAKVILTCFLLTSCWKRESGRVVKVDQVQNGRSWTNSS